MVQRFLRDARHLSVSTLHFGLDLVTQLRLSHFEFARTSTAAKSKARCVGFPNAICGTGTGEGFVISAASTDPSRGEMDNPRLVSRRLYLQSSRHLSLSITRKMNDFTLQLTDDAVVIFQVCCAPTLECDFLSLISKCFITPNASQVQHIRIVYPAR
jgi:hypothetical protein